MEINNNFNIELSKCDNVSLYTLDKIYDPKNINCENMNISIIYSDQSNNNIYSKNVYDVNTVKNKKYKKSKFDIKNKLNEDIPMYDYYFLLNRIYCDIRKNINHKHNRIISPIIKKISTRKNIWNNFMEICLSLNRESKILISFISKELNINTYILNNELIIKTRVTQSSIENLLKIFVINYVQCNSCFYLNTEMIKTSFRVFEIKCLKCNSIRYVSLLCK